MSTYPTQLQVLGISGKEEWLRVQKERARVAQSLGLLDKSNRPFRLVMIPEILSLISEISQDKGFLSSLKLSRSYVQSRSQSALKKEAYFSSKIEGAVTSLEVALRNMKKKTRNFADESMQMIYNNKIALEFMHSQKGKQFTESTIKELQKILLHNTHKDRPVTVGEYRKGPIYVVDGYGKVVYEGPPPDKARQLMSRFVEWMNAPARMHPLVDAAIVHFYFVHVHPFDDGNGRSARALSNLYLEKNGYDFINLLSPSDYFEHHKSAYYKSIRAVEEHDNDTTYFTLYYLEALKGQLSSVKAEIEKEKKIKDIRSIIDKNIWAKLNKRHIKGIRWMMNTGESLSTRKYCKLNDCSDETARKDFIFLESCSLIRGDGSGRSSVYFLAV